LGTASFVEVGTLSGKKKKIPSWYMVVVLIFALGMWYCAIWAYQNNNLPLFLLVQSIGLIIAWLLFTLAKEE
jgi:hypothetical protein